MAKAASSRHGTRISSEPCWRTGSASRSSTDQAVCTMQRSLYAGLPAKLEKAGPALGPRLSRRTWRATGLMLKMAKPKKDGYLLARRPDRRPAQAACAGSLLRADVEAERAIEQVIPKLPLDEVHRLQARLRHQPATASGWTCR